MVAVVVEPERAKFFLPTFHPIGCLFFVDIGLLILAIVQVR